MLVLQRRCCSRSCWDVNKTGNTKDGVTKSHCIVVGTYKGANRSA